MTKINVKADKTVTPAVCCDNRENQENIAENKDGEKNTKGKKKRDTQR